MLDPRGKEPVLKTWTIDLKTCVHQSKLNFPVTSQSWPNDPLVIAPGVPEFVDIPFPLPSILRNARNARNAMHGEYLDYQLSGPLHGKLVKP